MEIWIPITIAAAAAQTVRFMLQKHLKSTSLSTAGATFARYLYSAPLVVVLILIYANMTDQELPQTSPRFWAFAVVGGLTQVLATLCVVALFSFRNFAVGITFKKTEVLLTAVVGYLVLGEGVSRFGALALLIGFAAVIVLSDPPENFGQGTWFRFFNKTAGLGLLSGGLFSISAVAYRGALLSLGATDVALRAGFTLAIVTSSQTLGMLLWFVWKDRQQITMVLSAWRVAGLVGLTSMIGSICWFSAFALQNAAYVGALGQVELIFSMAATTLFFHEKISAKELAGIAVLMASILVLVVFI